MRTFKREYLKRTLVWVSTLLHRPPSIVYRFSTYCISCYFREGFIFANFASQTLAKISTSIHVYL